MKRNEKLIRYFVLNFVDEEFVTRETMTMNLLVHLAKWSQVLFRSLAVVARGKRQEGNVE